MLPRDDLVQMSIESGARVGVTKQQFPLFTWVSPQIDQLQVKVDCWCLPHILKLFSAACVYMNMCMCMCVYVRVHISLLCCSDPCIRLLSLSVFIICLNWNQQVDAAPTCALEARDALAVYEAEAKASVRPCCWRESDSSFFVSCWVPLNLGFQSLGIPSNHRTWDHSSIETYGDDWGSPMA